MRIRYKRFTFTTSYSGRTIVEVITERDFERRRYDITEATYNRFAALVNKGAVDVTILPANHGVAWEIVRI